MLYDTSLFSDNKNVCLETAFTFLIQDIISHLNEEKEPPKIHLYQSGRALAFKLRNKATEPLIELKEHTNEIFERSWLFQLKNRNLALPCPAVNADETLCCTILSNKFWKQEGKKKSGSTNVTISPNSPLNWVFRDKVMF